MIKHYKGDPSRYIIKYVSGNIKKEGLGISFYYLPFNTNIVAIPATTVDSHFIFNEMSNNYQNVTLQGHFTYKITDASKMDRLLDFQIDAEDGSYLSEDPEKLEMRIKNVVQMATRSVIKEVSLEEALALNTSLAEKVIGDVRKAEILHEMGIEVLSITYNAIKPSPEIERALEADYRESLQQKADRSIYARRAAAVEQEQKIKENELNTDISIEEKRKELVDLSGENVLKEAEFTSKARELELDLYKAADPRMLLALSFLELSGNAGKIGNLTVTSEILASLLNGTN